MAAVEQIETSDEVRQARVDMAAALQLAARMGMAEGIDNHLTVRVPGTSDRYFINPKCLHWSEIRASDILVVDREGTVYEGDDVPPRSGICIHIPIHEAHPHGGVVFHTHMPWATAISAVKGGRLEMCHQNSVRFHGNLAYDDDFNGIAVDPEEGRRMAAIYGDKLVMFLANHGPVVVCETVAEAFDHMYFLERASQVQVLAASMGKPLHIIPDDIIEMTKAHLGQFRINSIRHFEALKRTLQRDGSDYEE